MPLKAGPNVLNFFTISLPGMAFKRVLIDTITELITQKAINKPTKIIGLNRPMTLGTNSALMMLIPIAHLSLLAKSGTDAFFQLAIGPIPIKKMPGTIIATKTVSKYGGPTEIFPMPIASISNGYKVPNKTEAVAVNSTTLLVSNKDSRETKSNFSPNPTDCARKANKVSAPPITTTRNSKINNPRLGSVAKACTEVRTPERTKNVPNKLSEKAQIESKTVHALNASRFSVTANE